MVFAISLYLKLANSARTSRNLRHESAPASCIAQRASAQPLHVPMRCWPAAAGLLLASRPPLPCLPPRLCASDDDSPFAGLVICTNTNICGKQNPTFTPGFGFASRAIECLRVLGPPGLEVNAGPCFIRCSSGVNAKLVLPEGQSATTFNGCELRQGRPFYQLNSVGECVRWLDDNLALTPPADKLRAYESYVDAIEILETRGEDSAARRASQALRLLDVAAAYALASEPESWPEPPAAQRRAWPGSVRETSPNPDPNPQP